MNKFKIKKGTVFVNPRRTQPPSVDLSKLALNEAVEKPDNIKYGTLKSLAWRANKRYAPKRFSCRILIRDGAEVLVCVRVK